MNITRRRPIRVLLAVAFLVTAVSVLGPAPSAMAATPTFAQFKVSLWPEFDDPRMLVIYEPTLDGSVSLPYKFSYPVPLDAQIGMTCQVAADGAHQCQPRQTSVVGKQLNVSYTVPSLRQLYTEYYTDLLGSKQPTQRKMTYTFVAPADISLLTVSVKQPKDASGFSIAPKPGGTETDSEGFTYDTFTFANVKAGKPLSFAISYTRPTWTPPVQKASTQNRVAAGGTAGTGPTGSAGGPQNSQTFALIAGIAFIGAFVLLMNKRRPVPQTRQQSRSSKPNTGSKRAPAKKAAGANSAAKAKGTTSTGARKPRTQS